MSDILRDNEMTLLTKILNLWSKSNEEVFQTILSRSISITDSMLTPKPSGQDTNLLKMKDFFAFPITISSGILGNFYLIFTKTDLARILDLIIGGDGSTPMKDFDELHLNVLEESINQLAGTLESLLSDNLIRNINVRLGKPDVSLKNFFVNWEMLCSSHVFRIEGVPDTKMEILIPSDFARELVSQMEEITNQKPVEAHSPNTGHYGVHPMKGASGMYRKATFPQLGTGENESGDPKIDLILDIPLEMTVVLGKTSISIKELVELGPGAIVELDNLAGEPVEILVNERLVGYGEVIVVEENFGIRIIDVVKGVHMGVSGGKKK